MKIEHEVRDVEITVYPSIAHMPPFSAGVVAPTPPVNDLLPKRSFKERLGAWWNAETPPKQAPEQELKEILHLPLSTDCEGEHQHKRTLGLIEVETDITAREFCKTLAKDGYCPASMSEAVCYTHLLESRGVRIGRILLLGTLIRTKEYLEKRLVMATGKSLDLIPFYPATSLKNYQVVVAKKLAKAGVPSP